MLHEKMCVTSQVCHREAGLSLLKKMTVKKAKHRVPSVHSFLEKFRFRLDAAALSAALLVQEHAQFDRIFDVSNAKPPIWYIKIFLNKSMRSEIDILRSEIGIH